MTYYKKKTYVPISREKKVLNQICKECGRYRGIPQQFCNECWREMDVIINNNVHKEQ